MSTPTEELRLKFRDSMANLAAAVNVITSNGSGGKCGITATAVVSITDTPPTVLVAVNKNSQMNPVFEENGTMCVNVLSSELEEVAKHFAGMTDVKMEDRFTPDMWADGALGQPVCTKAISNLEGKIAKKDEYGTHYLYFVQLENIQVNGQDALMYFNRKFKTLSHE